MQISRIRLSDWFHDQACEAPGVPLARDPAPLDLVVELPLKRPDLNGVFRLLANLLSSAPSEAPRTRAPSLHRNYPASTVLMSPSDAHLGPFPTKRLRVSESLASMGLPCCDAFYLYVPPPLPRRVTRKP